jgi:hypothetical protein
LTPAGVCWRDEHGSGATERFLANYRLARQSGLDLPKFLPDFARVKVQRPVAGSTAKVLSNAMLPWNWTTKSICALVAIATYVALAQWSKASFVDYTPTGKTVVRIFRPFEKLGTSSFAVIAHEWTTRGSLDDIADADDDEKRSPVLIYENRRQLGPAHSNHGDIAKLGMGRYSHWRGQGYVISSSDNSDPNTNGRFYWAVVPY